MRKAESTWRLVSVDVRVERVKTRWKSVRMEPIIDSDYNSSDAFNENCILHWHLNIWNLPRSQSDLLSSFWLSKSTRMSLSEFLDAEHTTGTILSNPHLQLWIRSPPKMINLTLSLHRKLPLNATSRSFSPRLLLKIQPIDYQSNSDPGIRPIEYFYSLLNFSMMIQ